MPACGGRRSGTILTAALVAEISEIASHIANWQSDYWSHLHRRDRIAASIASDI